MCPAQTSWCSKQAGYFTITFKAAHPPLHDTKLSLLGSVEMSRDCQKRSLFNRLEVHLMHLVWTLFLLLHISLRQERQAGTFVHHSWSHPMLAAICMVSAKQCETRANRGWSALKDVVMRVSRCDSAAVRKCEVMVLHLLDFRGLRHFVLGTGVA